MNEHVWTRDPSPLTGDTIIYKFIQYLSYDVKHIVKHSRQRELMDIALHKWMAHIPVKFAQMNPGAPFDCDASFYIRLNPDPPDSVTIAQGSAPKTPECQLHYPGWEPENELNNVDPRKASIKFVSAKKFVDREIWEHAFWAWIAFEPLFPPVGWIAWLITWGVIRATHSDYRACATHELGHILGLGHSGNSGTVMWPTIKDERYNLNEHDIRAIRSLYPEVISKNEPLPDGQPYSATLGMYTGPAGTQSRVIELPKKRTLLAWCSMGWQESLASFDRDNGVFTDVFAIGGQEVFENKNGQQLDPAGILVPYGGGGQQPTLANIKARADEVPSKIDAFVEEQQTQLTHEYSRKWGNVDTYHFDRAPRKLGMAIEHMGGQEGEAGACAIYRGYARATGDRVQFRASAFHPGDHRMYATGCVLMIPMDELGLALTPPTPPPAPGSDRDIHGDVVMVPDPQRPPMPPWFAPTPLPPPLGFANRTPPEPPPLPGIATEPPQPGNDSTPDRDQLGRTCACAPGGRMPPEPDFPTMSGCSRLRRGCDDAITHVLVAPASSVARSAGFPLQSAGATSRFGAGIACPKPAQETLEEGGRKQ